MDLLSLLLIVILIDKKHISCEEGIMATLNTPSYVNVRSYRRFDDMGSWTRRSGLFRQIRRRQTRNAFKVYVYVNSESLNLERTPFYLTTKHLQQTHAEATNESLRTQTTAETFTTKDVKSKYSNNDRRTAPESFFSPPTDFRTIGIMSTENDWNIKLQHHELDNRRQIYYDNGVSTGFTKHKRDNIRNARFYHDYEDTTEQKKDEGFVSWVMSWFGKGKTAVSTESTTMDEDALKLYKATHPDFIKMANSTIVAKCYVCGLFADEIPRSPKCGDAFGSDALPAAPVDPVPKVLKYRFKTYCRYMEVDNFYVNGSQPRSIFGQFTGGCSVRWVDVTSVYTQRTCRNVQHPVVGSHLISRRMAKLELSLKDIENGCIITPVSSLVPLARGVSLYARFHACVCTGDWCNITHRNTTWMTFKAIILFFFVLSFNISL